ncbi:hypothetical protein GCM10025868_05230 [Angustibacter aerolatus]|uniref:Uncharacterized protein n=1 Tax=Angustibacter aerolatus TaxID=1162965 RepID=A0ABQ6JAS5_9ACTN|nr:hypothetical protein [Angustibacter aerolatus]GMA85273.1 hypothetical protein GCM10025868_05230 [Angustibacter aerolatus]
MVLGGYFVPLGPLLLPTVREVLGRRASTRPGGATASGEPACRVEPSTLGLQAAALGAATDVLAEVYAGTLALA